MLWFCHLDRDPGGDGGLLRGRLQEGQVPQLQGGLTRRRGGAGGGGAATTLAEFQASMQQC